MNNNKNRVHNNKEIINNKNNIVMIIRLWI